MDRRFLEELRLQKERFKKEKELFRSGSDKPKHFNVKRQRNNAGVDSRNADDLKKLRRCKLHSDGLACDAPKVEEAERALAEKAKIYEYLESRASSVEDSDRLLVDFSAKVARSEPTVETVDEFGRTVYTTASKFREAEAKARLQSVDGLMSLVDESNLTSVTGSDTDCDSEGYLNAGGVDKLMDGVARSLEVGATRVDSKPFLDDRTLGAANFKFSTRSKERKQQLEALSELRNETRKIRNQPKKFQCLLETIKRDSS